MAYKGKYDFCGWASKNNLRCKDGRVIRHGAFSGLNGKKVPLCWNHEHNDPEKVLGHCILEERDEGLYTYGSFNNTPRGKHAKACLQHGDIDGMSIWADELDQVGHDVYKGNVREVSLVIAGANPGAFVESVLAHGLAIDEDDVEGIFYSGEPILMHSADVDDEDLEDDDDSEETVGDVYETLTRKQKAAVSSIIEDVVSSLTDDEDDDEDDDDLDEDEYDEDDDEDDDDLDEDEYDEDEEEPEMKHNVFDSVQENADNIISHSMQMEILEDAKKNGSLKASVASALGEDQKIIAHAVPTAGMTTATGSQTYGFNDPSMLFPDYKSLNNPPEWISRNMDWVQEVMGDVHHIPFTRIKSVYADITEDEARARGYIKGTQKKTEVFTTLKRTTEPQTIYKLQKMDRDDITDIKDFEVVAWIKAEMRVMLNEEIARAILIGDGRASDSEYKIKEDRIRPIAHDVALFNTTYFVNVPADADEDVIAKAVIKASIKSRKKYKGSGNPKFWTTEDYLTDMLLLEDAVGHKLYKTEGELATALRCRKVTTVEPMEGQTVTVNSRTYPLVGIICNLNDYCVGTDKGGEINMFDDFDIDFNQYKYLIETRMSGALVKPYSAVTLLLNKAAAPVKNEGED